MSDSDCKDSISLASVFFWLTFGPSVSEDFSYNLLDQMEKAKRIRLDASTDSAGEVLPEKQRESIRFEENFKAALKSVEAIDRTSKLTVFKALEKFSGIIIPAARAVTALPPTQVSVERLFFRSAHH